MNDVSGSFEIHLTVDPSSRDIVRRYSEALGYKFIDIELDRGDNAFQPMLSYYVKGDLDYAYAASQTDIIALLSLNARVVRNKIEAVPRNKGVPQTFSEVVNQPQGRYFEHHLKLRLEDRHIPVVTRLAARNEARLSRNAMRINTDRSQERFITQRCEGLTYSHATMALEFLENDLRDAGFKILSKVQEYVVYDSNYGLDAGWI